MTTSAGPLALSQNCASSAPTREERSRDERSRAERGTGPKSPQREQVCSEGGNNKPGAERTFPGGARDRPEKPTEGDRCSVWGGHDPGNGRKPRELTEFYSEFKLF